MARLLAIRQQHALSIRLMSLHFLTFAAVGMASPYINIYLTDLDFSATAIGTLASVGAVLSLSLTPLLNRIADRLLLHRRLLMAYIGGFALALIIFANFRLPLLIIGAVLLYHLTVSPSITLGMQLTMTQLLHQGKAILGQVRSFAALGFTIASLLAGLLFAQGGYPLLFWTGAIFLILSVQISTVFPAKPKRKPDAQTASKTPRSRAFYVLLISQFFTMMGTRNTYYFIFIHISDNLGVPTADIGLWAALLAAVEIPFFVVLDSIMPRLPMRRAYILGILGGACFTLLLGVVQTLPALALLLLFRGFSWPLLHLSSYTLVADISHPHNVATNQALIHVTMPAIAMLLTGSLFGWVFDHLGAGAFFALCSLACFLGAAAVFFGFRFFVRRSPA